MVKSQHNIPQHSFHLVDPSPLPIITSFCVLMMASGAIMFMHDYPVGKILFPFGLICVISCAFSWWSDVIKEGKIDKAHSIMVQRGLSWGMMLFIMSEVMFFFGFFFSFFKVWLDPVYVLDDSNLWTIGSSLHWPPFGVKTFDPWDIPLMNTLILLLSGTTVTWAHHELLNGNRENLVRGLKYTIFLGMSFTILQAFEYHHAAFGFTQGVYPSVFYMITGFHGIHVIIGTAFLSICYFRAKKGDFDLGNNHLGFEFATWYWHFVDVVWVFLYVFVYVLAK